MNLQDQAQAEPERRTRSKLEAHREAIVALRRKHWTYGQIVAWLRERGVAATLSSVYRLCGRANSRRPRPMVAGPPSQSVAGQPLSVPQPSPPNKKHRFNVDI